MVNNLQLENVVMQLKIHMKSEYFQTLKKSIDVLTKNAL